MSFLTHFRKVFNSPYLSSADITETVDLTISHVTQEPDRTKRTKDVFNTAHFTQKFLRDGETLKPMILNVTNSKVLKDITGSPFIEDWQNIDVAIFVDKNVRFGRETMEGLRVAKPRVKQKPVLTPNSPNWNAAIKAYKRDGHFGSILSKAVISPEHQKLIIEGSANV